MAVSTYNAIRMSLLRLFQRLKRKHRSNRSYLCFARQLPARHSANFHGSTNTEKGIFPPIDHRGLCMMFPLPTAWYDTKICNLLKYFLVLKSLLCCSGYIISSIHAECDFSLHFSFFICSLLYSIIVVLFISVLLSACGVILLYYACYDSY